MHEKYLLILLYSPTGTVKNLAHAMPELILKSNSNES